MVTHFSFKIIAIVAKVLRNLHLKNGCSHLVGSAIVTLWLHVVTITRTCVLLVILLTRHARGVALPSTQLDSSAMHEQSSQLSFRFLVCS